MMAYHHSHRRQQKTRSTARLGIAGGVTGVLGVAAVAGLIVVARAHGHQDEPAPRSVAIRTSSAGAGSLARLKTGDKLDVSTPDGFGYSLGAVRAGTSDKPLTSSRTPPPTGTTLAYIDYVITNTGTQPALLDFPADLFVKRSLLPPKVLAAGRCMPQPGAPADMCTLPDHTDVVNTLGFPAPTSQDEDQYIPAGASYLVRVATDMPVSRSVTQNDVGLYVWNPRFVPDRQAVKVKFPSSG
jgi:hypothetical protein